MKINSLILFVLTILLSSIGQSQCGFQPTCSNTDYLNFGIGSNTNAATIEYDNFISSFHTTVVRTAQGTYKVWGEQSANSGSVELLAPTEINATNFPALTGTILKAHLGSSSVYSASISGSGVQGIVLTTTGLFAWGAEGAVLHPNITSSSTFQKLTIGGNTQGLPTGVTPTDVKMLFVTNETIALTTCSGNVYVLTLNGANAGRGFTGILSAANAVQWYQVTTSAAGNPALSNVIAVRGSKHTLFALTSTGQLFTWGSETYLGNNTAIAERTRATLMTLPSANPIKMIGATRDNVNGVSSYYVLNANGNLYALGGNTERQLGDWSTTERRSWIQPRYTSSTGPVLSNIRWISPNEHDDNYAAINVLTSDSTNFNWGDANGELLGRGGTTNFNPGMPNGVSSTDRILAVETGGHTSMLAKKCEDYFGYVGHRIRGSMGDGTSNTTNESVYTFATAVVYICGATNVEVNIAGTPVISTSGNYCNGTTINITASPSGGTYSLTGPATISNNNLTFTGTTNSTVNLTYTFQVPGCPNPVAATIQLPTENCVIADAGPATARICSGNTYTTAGASTNGTIAWTSSGTGAFTNGTTNTATYTPSAADISAGSVTLTTTVTGSSTLSDSIVLTINTTPSSATGNVVQPTCATTTGTIVFTTQSGVGYSIDGTTYQSSATFTGVAPGTYTLRVRSTTDTTCITSGSSVTVNAVATAPSTPAGSVTVQPTCATTTGTIVFTTQSGVGYSIDGTTYQSSATFTGVAPGTYTLRVRSTTDTTCITSGSSVTVNAVASAPSTPAGSVTVQPTCATTTGTIVFTTQSGVL
jgi:hypothetical protein